MQVRFKVLTYRLLIFNDLKELHLTIILNYRGEEFLRTCVVLLSVACLGFFFFLFAHLSECTSEWSVVEIRVSELIPEFLI